jgi:hypothetical protein
MNKYINVLSLVLVITGSVYLPNANATGTTNSMLITVAETDPVLVDRLNDVASHNPELLNKLLKMADSDVAQLKRSLDLAENNPELFGKISKISNLQRSKRTKRSNRQSTFGTIDDDGVIQN